MNQHQNPLHQICSSTSTKAILAATRAYSEAFCLPPADRPAWIDDDLDHDPLPTIADDDAESSEVICASADEADLMRRLAKTISMSPTSSANVLAAGPLTAEADPTTFVEVDFDTWPTGSNRGAKKPPRKTSRTTTRLDADDVERMLTAYGRGRLMGFEWTAFLTIAWATVGILTDEQVSAAMASLTTRLREWATRSKDVTGLLGVAVAWIWVHERGPLCGKLHSHMLLAVPRRKRATLGRVVIDHLKRYSGVEPTHQSHVIKLRAAVGSHPPAGGPEDAQAVSTPASAPFSATMHITAPRRGKAADSFPSDRMRYLAKAIDPMTSIQLANGARVSLAEWIGVEYLADQGAFRGKRCGYSVFSLGGNRWKDWANKHNTSQDLFAYRFRNCAPLDDGSLNSLVHLLRMKT